METVKRVSEENIFKNDALRVGTGISFQNLYSSSPLRDSEAARSLKGFDQPKELGHDMKREIKARTDPSSPLKEIELRRREQRDIYHKYEELPNKWIKSSDFRTTRSKSPQKQIQSPQTFIKYSPAQKEHKNQTNLIIAQSYRVCSLKNLTKL